MSRLKSKFIGVTSILSLIFNCCGNVLCYGNDGHIAVEPAFHNHCNHDEHSHKPDCSGYEQSCTCMANKCNPCVDILTLTDIEPVRIQFQLLHDLSSLNAVAVNSVDPLGIIKTFQEDIFSFFKPLKTIILLT